MSSSIAYAALCGVYTGGRSVTHVRRTDGPLMCPLSVGVSVDMSIGQLSRTHQRTVRRTVRRTVGGTLTSRELVT
jgi:hypothetical protein